MCQVRYRSVCQCCWIGELHCLRNWRMVVGRCTFVQSMYQRSIPRHKRYKWLFAMCHWILCRSNRNSCVHNLRPRIVFVGRRFGMFSVQYWSLPTSRTNRMQSMSKRIFCSKQRNVWHLFNLFEWYSRVNWCCPVYSMYTRKVPCV